MPILKWRNVPGHLHRMLCTSVFPSGLTITTLIFGFMRSLIMFNILVKSAQALHNRMFNCILRTPVRFFDINPVGKQKVSGTLLLLCMLQFTHICICLSVFFYAHIWRSLLSSIWCRGTDTTDWPDIIKWCNGYKGYYDNGCSRYSM